jgi:hypothetical protein
MKNTGRRDQWGLDTEACVHCSAQNQIVVLFLETIWIEDSCRSLSQFIAEMYSRPFNFNSLAGGL